MGGFTPVIDSTGKITGYKTTKGGADTVFPFLSGVDEFAISFTCYSRGNISFVYDKEIGANVVSNFETPHFKIGSVYNFTIISDGQYRIIKLYCPNGNGTERVLSDTTETITAGTAINAMNGYTDSANRGQVIVVIVIPLT